MDDGAVKVVDHELEDRLDVLLSVASIVGESGIPLATLQHSTGKVHGSGGDVTGRVLQEAVVEAANLEKVFAESTGLDVVVVGLGDATKEVHGVGVGQVVVQSTKDETLSLEDLGLSEAIVGDVLEVLDVGREDFLVLRSNEHGSDTDKLKAVELDNLARQEAIDDVHCQEKGLRQQPKARVNLQQPVDEDATHLPFEFILAVHVVRVGQGGDLKLLHIVEDFVHVLSNHERVIKILGVEVLSFFREFLQGLVVELILEGIKSEFIRSQQSLGTGLLSDEAILGRGYILGGLLLNVGDGGRLCSRRVALLRDRVADPSSAGRPLLEIRGSIVGL